jgi:hypothetical protein
LPSSHCSRSAARTSSSARRTVTLSTPSACGDGGPHVAVGFDRERTVAVTGTDRPRPEVRVEVRVGDERRSVEHREHGVEVHERVRARQLGSDDLGRLTGGEERRGELLDRHRRRSLAHADDHRSVAEHVHVAALDRRRLVVDVIAAQPGVERRRGEHRVEPVDRPHVEGLALARRLGHRVDGHPAVHPRRVVPREEMVG